ncbi:hypothetical protein D3C71_1766660 [compost metagenome]
MRPFGLCSTVPLQGRNDCVVPDLSFCQEACSVSEVAALGCHVSEGASIMRSSWAYCIWVSLSRPTATTR